jgi:hypothetical protein
MFLSASLSPGQGIGLHLRDLEDAPLQRKDLRQLGRERRRSWPRNHETPVKGEVICVISFPTPADGISESTGEIRTRERLGGLLKFYYRETECVS